MLKDTIINKLLNGVYLLTAKDITPTLIVENVRELDSDMIDVMSEAGIKGLILDVDNTLRNRFQELSSDTLDWLDMVNSRMSVAVVSNGYDKKIADTLNARDIPYYKLAFKPFKKNVLKALDGMGLDGDETLFVGNSMMSDMRAGKNVGSKLCLVKKNKNKK